MSIYLELIERVDNGETFHIDFEKRNMKVGNDYLIKNGEYDTSRELFDKYYDVYSIYSLLHMIRELYKMYKYSLPSERSDSKRRKYFKALPIEELTDDQLVRAQRRETAQATLEGFILCNILAGYFKWDEDVLGRWFYQDKKEENLIILRKWIERKGE